MSLLKKWIVRPLIIANIAVIAGMWLLGHADHINPAHHAGWETLGLLFPIALLANLLFLFFWILFHWRYAWVSLVGFLLCFHPIRIYLPLHLASSTADATLKVISFNVMYFDRDHIPEDSTCHVANYIVESDADLVCLQEAPIGSSYGELIDSILFRAYPYHIEHRKSPDGDALLLLSKYPILSSEVIDYESKSNISAAYVVNVNGDKMLIVNNHLESNRLTQDEKNEFGEMVKGSLSEKNVKKESWQLFHKLSEGAHKRASQAEAVARYVREHRKPGMSVIVAGDFNEQPISYVCRTIGDGLTNCYVSSGTGPGFSYHHNHMYVRIDHLFCSEEWVPVRCVVERKIEQSDHYPVVCWMKKSPKH